MVSSRNKNVAAVVLAAGKGTRMKSSIPKVLHELLGTPLVGHVVSLLNKVDVQRIVTVVGHGAQAVTKYLEGFGVETVIQDQQLGTGHAVACAEGALEGFDGAVLVICGDTPLFRQETLDRFIHEHLASRNQVSVLSSRFASPYGYGRIVRDQDDAFIGIVEEKDADSAVRDINEVNTGTYMVDADFLFPALSRLDNNNRQGEYYLTDIVAIAVETGNKVGAFCLASEQEALGVNSRSQLSEAESIMMDRIRHDLMMDGVTLLSAHTIYVEPSVAIGNDVVIEPCVVLRGDTRIGAGAMIGAHSYLSNVEVAEGEQVPPYSKLVG